jgi:hypothetical protein
LSYSCAICAHLGLTPQVTTNFVTLKTEIPGLVRAAAADRPRLDAEDPIVVPSCPEHAVDIYRGRIPGMHMAWRLLADPVG